MAGPTAVCSSAVASLCAVWGAVERGGELHGSHDLEILSFKNHSPHRVDISGLGPHAHMQLIYIYTITYNM